MCTNKNIGKLTTFYEMISENQEDFVDKILIPQIQRDYAQGRPNRGRLRERFLNRLFLAIDSSKTEKCEIDYIYGKKKLINRKYVFLPIDGQQRLTTLFLLHLYIAKRAGVEQKELDNLTKFSYETRDSSKQFCKKLNNISSENFIGIKIYIENQWWYNARWKNDPTISSMIVMLNDIDNHYEGNEWNFKEIWERLKVNITFWRLYLDDLEATDDLYIKMNSRGKLLTDFEHFKAQIVSYIPNEDKYRDFSRKIDTDWTYLLWDYRNTDYDNDPNKYMDNGLDKMFLNIFTLFMFIEGVKNKIIEYSELDNNSKFESLDSLDLAEKVIKPYPELFKRFERIMDFFYQKINVEQNKNVKTFFEGILTNIPYEKTSTNDSYLIYIPSNELGESVDYLNAVARGNGLSSRKVLMVEAFFEIASIRKDNNDVIDDADIKEKVRIIRNLAFNSDTRSERMLTLLYRVDKIISDVYDIDGDETRGFNQGQSEQEINKLDWIKTFPIDEMTIKNVENHSLIIGNLCIYMEGKVCLIDAMKRHKELFHKEVDYELIERLLLTMGDFSYKYRGRKQYGGKTCQLWKDNIFAHTNKDMTKALKKLYENSPFRNQNTLSNNDEVKRYITDWLQQKEDSREFTWEYYLVKYDGMRKGDEARYLIGNGKYDYIMLNRNQLNGKHWYPFLCCIHEFFKDESILHDYGDSLNILGYKIESYENHYKVMSSSNVPKKIDIPQNDDGIDREDRILLAEGIINKILRERQLNCVKDNL